jgi:signal transduction histidine kinase/CheY-like chemotaxis protein/ligand-binding sensor domain-containing protein
VRLGRSALACALLLSAAAPDASGQSHAGWRYWTPADGIQESHSRRIGSQPGGGVTVRHGLVERMDVLDGYIVESIPEPRTGNVPEAFIAAVHGSSPGEAWTVSEGTLKQHRDGRWIVRSGPPAGEPMLAAVPVAAGRVLVLFAGRVASYDAAASSWATVVDGAAAGIGPLSSMVRGFAGEIWIAAARGIGRLDLHGPVRWTPHVAPGLEDFTVPLPGDGGELFAAAVDARSRAKVAVRLAGGRFARVFSSSKPLRAWRGPDDSIWVLEGTRTWRLAGGSREPVARHGPLSGLVYDVITEPGGAFWIASSTGIGRYAPPLWRTPQPLQTVDQPVHGAVEDRAGRLWFAATEALLELDGTTWRVHPLPLDVRTVPNQTSALALLDDGRLLMTVSTPGVHRLMTFDPRTRAFGSLEHRDGDRLRQVWNGHDGRVWIRSDRPCRIEVLDRAGIRDVPALSDPAVCSRLRELHEGPDGSVWYGTTTHGGGVLRPGAATVTRFGPGDGYPEQAVYALLQHRPDGVLAGGREVLAEREHGRWVVRQTEIDAVRSLMRAGDGTIWMASGSGVHRRAGDVWISNGEADGLPADAAFKVFEDSRGRIWAGTARGLSLYHPEADRDAPRVLVAASNLTEAPPDGDVAMAFSGVDRWKYTVPERLLFSHRIDGGAWSPFRSGGSASLQGLARGRHVFEVRAMDRNGNVGRTESFAFAVLFPWYQQPGFLAIAGASALVIGALLGFARVQYRQLARAKRAAETANRCKSEFLAHMSHEIRTPMNAIMGMTELAMEAGDPAEQRQYLTAVQQASGSLLALLNDILDLSKVEAGKLVLAEEAFDLHGCVRDALDTLALRAGEKGLRLQARIAPDTPRYVRGDGLRVRQILLNLLGNAIKFTEHGAVTVGVRPGPPAAAGDVELRFVVTDTGIGVPAEKQKVIFAPFEQADRSTTRRYGGTGLGLAITSQLVQLMHGTIEIESPWVDDETGARVAGTAFRFTARVGTASAPARVEEARAARPTRSLHVLVAEDNPVNQMLATRLLQKLGHTVVTASTGTEALRVLDGVRPDVILMDVQMPEMDGFEATAAIRQRQAGGPRTPIVALTAHALQGYREQCLQAGMDDYLTKPIRQPDLERALARVIGEPAAA